MVSPVNRWLASVQNLAPKGRLTIALCHYLGNCIQTLFGTANFEFPFYKESRNQTLEVILYSTLPLVLIRPSIMNSGRFLKANSNTAVRSEGKICVCSWYELARTRWGQELGSCHFSFMFNWRPMLHLQISISCTMDLKGAVGMRERWMSEVLISFILRPGSRPTNEAIVTYLTWEVYAIP
jgi:hypothetical protein